MADQKEAKEKADRDKADYEKKIADGKKKVEELTDRFGAWYYVTPGESFRSINLDRAAITPAQEATRPARRPVGLRRASATLAVTAVRGSSPLRASID